MLRDEITVPLRVVANSVTTLALARLSLLPVSTTNGVVFFCMLKKKVVSFFPA